MSRVTPAVRKRACRSDVGLTAARAAAPCVVGEESARDSAWTTQVAFGARGRDRAQDGGASEESGGVYWARHDHLCW